MFERKLQIQQNIPQSDKDNGFGYQHITNLQKLYNEYNVDITTHVSNIQGYIGYVKKGIAYACQMIQKNNIHYSELLVDSKYGEDYVMLDKDINLLQKTDFDNVGYKIFDIQPVNGLMQNFIRNEISFITKKEILLEKYHNSITDEEHTAILNSMPYKKNMYPDIKEFSDYLEKTVSEILGESVKIFNDDLMKSQFLKLDNKY